MDHSEHRAASQANVAAYEACRDFLFREHSGEYVLIYGGTVRAIFPSKGEAARAGDESGAYPCAVVRIVPSRQPFVGRTPAKMRVFRTSALKAT